MKKIMPGSVIGIIGGGQLGRMIAASAKEMGYRIAILDPNSDACAKVYSDFFIQAEFNDFEQVEELCKLSDVVTFEFENIDCEVINRLSKKYYFTQSAQLLEISQHRGKEKLFAQDLGIPTVPFVVIGDNTNIEINKKYLMKTLRFGYDGKGQKIISCKDEVEKHTILEEFVNLEKEISVVACKAVNGIHIIGVVENEHKNNILYRSFIPAHISKELVEKAKQYTLKILEQFEYYGVLTVEYFIVDSEIVFNEMAPRVHNSGHITMQSNNVSQFNAHVRGICGLPIPNITTVSTTMYNILGQDLERYLEKMHQEEGFIHLYEKEARLNRKIGHINFFGRKENE